MDAADGQWHAAVRRPLADLDESPVGHGEHAGDGDQVRLKLGDCGIQTILPSGVEIELPLARGFMAGAQNFVVQIANPRLHADARQMARQNRQPIRRIIGVTAAPGGGELEYVRFGVWRRDQKEPGRCAHPERCGPKRPGLWVFPSLAGKPTARFPCPKELVKMVQRLWRKSVTVVSRHCAGPIPCGL